MKLQLLVISVILFCISRQVVFEQHYMRLLSTAEQQAENVDQTTRNVSALNGKATIFGQDFGYRYPSSLLDIQRAYSTMSDQDNSPVLLVGVLSAAKNKAVRDTIRETWASSNGTGQQRHVYFLVSGNFEPLRDEFHSHGDLLWLQGPEDYRLIAYKVNLFFHAVHAHVDHNVYDYLLKTDDDSFVNLKQASTFLSSVQPMYSGVCRFDRKTIRRRQSKWYISKAMYPRDTLPPFAQGCGYFLSKTFHQCLVEHLPNSTFVPNEDVGVGIMAEKCGVKCTSMHQVEDFNDVGTVVYGIEKDEDLKYLAKRDS